jgi:D-sedoheptulose 7-phosphate isomerase
MEAHLRALGRQIGALSPTGIEPLAAAVEAAWRSDRTVFIAGNGGSAATASHFATDLCKTTLSGKDQVRGVRAVALTDNVGLLTAWANDQSFDQVFAEQLRNLARRDDVLITMSTSGESINLIEAVAAAREREVHTLALAPSGSTLARSADVVIPVESESIQVAEDLHHIVCHAVTLHMADTLAAA